MDRDTRPLKQRTKFMQSAWTSAAIVLCVGIGAIAGALDTTSLAAACVALGGIGGVTTWAQGRVDEKRGG